jgi:hypothetical protein
VQALAVPEPLQIPPICRDAGKLQSVPWQQTGGTAVLSHVFPGAQPPWLSHRQPLLPTMHVLVTEGGAVDFLPQILAVPGSPQPQQESESQVPQSRRPPQPSATGPQFLLPADRQSILAQGKHWLGFSNPQRPCSQLVKPQSTVAPQASTVLPQLLGISLHKV